MGDTDEPCPHHTDHDQNRDWVSTFNDWSSGQNFQIEHRLFPMILNTMTKEAPLAQSGCAKYSTEYQSMPLLSAFADTITH